MTLYNLKTDGDNYRVTKFTSDLDVESSYLTSLTECECPAGHRPTCRHRQMLPLMLAEDMLDRPKFMDFDTKSVYVSAFAEEPEEEFFESSGAEIESPVEVEQPEPTTQLSPDYPRPEYTEGTEGDVVERSGMSANPIPPGEYTITEPNENGKAEIVSGEYRGREVKFPSHPSISGTLKRRI